MDYGCESFGRLRRALVHTPSPETLGLINAANHRHYLFDYVPDVPRFLAEHRRYAELLASLGVEVHQVADHVSEHRALMQRLPNLAYLHDIAVVHSRGAILSRMAWPGRAGEEVVVGEALRSLGVPLLWECDGAGAFEGCLLLSERTVFVAETERHSPQAVERFTSCLLAQGFAEVIVAEVFKARRFMHPDTLLGRVSERLALIYLPAFRRTWLVTAEGRREVDPRRVLEERGFELVEVSEGEQRRLACTFVALEPGVILHYDDALDGSTRRRLERKGVELVPFAAEAMHAGGGSLRCITLRLCRAKQAAQKRRGGKGKGE